MSGKIICSSTLLALLCLGMAGCRKADNPVPPRQGASLTLRPGVYQTNNVVRFYKTLPPDGVLVQVGSRKLTHAEFQYRVDERVAMHQRPGPQKNYSQERKRLEREAQKYCFINFMTRAAMLIEAEKRGIKPTEADLNDAERYMDILCRRLRMTREAFAARFAGSPDAVERRIRDEATVKALLRDEFGDKFKISDDMAEAFRSDLLRMEAQTDATNRMHAATLEQLRGRLISGELKIPENADANAITNMLAKEVEMIGIKTYSGYEMHFLQQKLALNKLKPGEWSDVVPLQDTFDLYKLISVVPNAEPDETEYTFLTLSLPREAAWEIPAIAKLKRDLSRNRRYENQVPWARKLIRNAGVLYPNGVQLFGDPSKARKPHARPSGPPRVRKLAPAARANANKEG